jgi:hypothetical protein
VSFNMECRMEHSPGYAVSRVQKERAGKERANGEPHTSKGVARAKVNER